MRPKTVISKFIEMAGYAVIKMPVYENGLRTLHNQDFMRDPSFCKAYERGCRADYDHKNRWRVYIGLWAAFTASKLAGDFVECGVNRGVLSSAIMEFLDWDSLNKTFYLLDTFEGLDPRYVSPEDLQCGVLERSRSWLEDGQYVRGVESVKVNFSQWKNTRIIKGSVPETLNQVETQNVAYLHLDMNCSPPEIAAINFFWDRLVPGAVILLDDYAFLGYDSQKHAMDVFGKEKQVMIASLPTGQGLLMKPPEGSTAKR
jgi:Macrocin-O-methyltransferase (TylF)